MFIVFALFLVAIALLFIIPPLRGNEQKKSDQHKQANLEITRQRLHDLEKEAENDLIASDQIGAIRGEAETTLLLETPNQEQTQSTRNPKFNKLWTTLIVIFVPVCAFFIYLSVGAPTALLDASEQPIQQPGQQLEQLVAQLEQRLQDNPDDAQGWLVLAQTSMMMQRYDESVKAMENLYRLKGDEPDVLSRYADALTMANQGRFTDKARELIKKSLSLNPNHVHTLWLAGVQAYQAEQFDKAIEFFQNAKVNTDDADNIAQIDDLISAAQARINNETLNQPHSSGVEIIVNVDIEQSLENKIDPNDSLFVFAKAAQGPPMPLAVSKHMAAELPLNVTLSDVMAMMSELKLSSFEQVIISARVSKSGQPSAQAGDLQGESDVVNPQKIEQVNIMIDQIIQ